MKRGEVYWARIGSGEGSEQAGNRPVLIIQSNLGNEASPTTIVAAITSKKKKSFPFHVEATANELGLAEDGTILLEQIRTISKERLVNRFGNLSDTKMLEVNKAIKFSLGLH